LSDSDRTLYAIIDGERQELGIGIREVQDERGFVAAMGGVRKSERLSFPMERDVFARIAKAKIVEMKIAQFEFKLKDEHRQAFRDLMSLADADR
jgi:hypothetical protein